MIDASASLASISAHLDALAPEARVREANALPGRVQARLWEIAADAAPIELEHFVPAARGSMAPVHHPGRNTILCPSYFQRFEKRFVKPEREDGRLFGYNASNAWFVHPGYFVAYRTAGHDLWAPRGGVVIDYHLVPDAPVPEGWPKVVPNSVGLQKLVYHRTRDFMRRVSSHVSIGRASREDEGGDQELDYWFTLCRAD